MLTDFMYQSFVFVHSAFLVAVSVCCGQHEKFVLFTILIAVCSAFPPQSQRVALVLPSRVDSDGSAASGDSFAPSNWVPFRQLKQTL
jgi:hypothetical protein